MKTSSLRSFIRAGAVGVLSLGLWGNAQAAEEVVTFPVNGQMIKATLETPDGGAGPAPVVLMLHGFTGSRDELPVKDTDEGVFSRTARQLAENGFASLRIDFRGSGESEGAWEDTTFGGQIVDAVAAVDFLKDNANVDGSRISLLGWSQGGLVAAHTAAARPEVRSMVLWAPATNPLAVFTNLFGKELVDKAIDGAIDEAHTFTLPWGAETTLKGAFFKQLPTTSTAGAVAYYPGPMLVIVGTNDTVVTPQPFAGRVLLDYHAGEEELVVFETDHVWDAFAGPTTLDEKMIPTTVRWFNEHP